VVLEVQILHHHRLRHRHRRPVIEKQMNRLKEENKVLTSSSSSLAADGVI
jgi:hypothetical protein